MPELKDKDVEEKCHFCQSVASKHFQYDIRFGTIDAIKRNVPTCVIHFGELCDTVYSKLNNYHAHLPIGQREYIAIKHLESKLDVKSTIQFN